MEGENASFSFISKVGPIFFFFFRDRFSRFLCWLKSHIMLSFQAVKDNKVMLFMSTPNNPNVDSVGKLSESSRRRC